MISNNLNILYIPSIVFFISAFIIPFFKGKLRLLLSLSVPVISFYFLNKLLNSNDVVRYSIFGFNLVIFVYDRISLLFSYIFLIFSFFGLLYASFTKRSIEIAASLFYLGASLGCVFAGDFFTFYLFWEVLTFGAAIFIYLGDDKDSINASFRYVIFHIIGGLVLLLGILLLYRETGNLGLRILNLNSLPSFLIFLGFGVNAGFPFLHTWITDSYPKASVAGSVFLSSLTTKVGIYALIRCFVGTEALIYIGAIMVIFPVFFAVIENDLRKVLSYSLINQLGFMIVGIGIGTNLAINGALSHVFVHIIYKSLLFMTIGAVIYKYKTCKVTELGNLYKKMPITTTCASIAALSIAAFPMFSGFVTKSMILQGAISENRFFVWLVLIIGSAAVIKYIKVPYCAFFRNNQESSIKLNSNKTKIPFCMTISMCFMALFCIIIGLFPELTLYKILPYNVDYKPYSYFHVISQLEILFFAILAIFLSFKYKFYKNEEDKLTLDFDYIYRRTFNGINKLIFKGTESLNSKMYSVLIGLGNYISNDFNKFSKRYIEKRMPVGITLSLISILILLLFFM